MTSHHICYSIEVGFSSSRVFSPSSAEIRGSFILSGPSKRGSSTFVFYLTSLFYLSSASISAPISESIFLDVDGLLSKPTPFTKSPLPLLSIGICSN